MSKSHRGPEVTAADILAELDRAVLQAQNRAIDAQENEEIDDYMFLDNVQRGLCAFRERLRSQEFLNEVTQRRKS